MRKTALSHLLVLPLLTLALVSAAWATDAPAAAKEWTVLVYIAGDNNLATAGLDDVNEMEAVGSSSDVNVVVQIDGHSSYSPDAQGTRRYFIQKDTDMATISSPVLGAMDEADMGDPQTLVDFIQFGFDQYPAKKYAVILWNHGNGWYPDAGTHRVTGEPEAPVSPLKAICSDDASGSAISTRGVGEIIKKMAGRLGRPIDVVGFDACLMGMAETFWELGDAARVAVASEKTEPGDGWPYDSFLQILSQKPQVEAEALGSTLVKCYAASYDNGTQGSSNVTQAAVRLDSAVRQNFAGALELFSEELVAAHAQNREAILAAVSKTQDFGVRSWWGTYFTTHKDLYDFAAKIKDELPGEGDLVAACDLMMEAIEGPGAFVIENGITHVSSSGTVDGAHGVAVYLPTEGYEATYKDLAFSKTAWFAFLEVLNEGKVIDAPTAAETARFGVLYGD